MHPNDPMSDRIAGREGERAHRAGKSGGEPLSPEPRSAVCPSSAGPLFPAIHPHPSPPRAIASTMHPHQHGGTIVRGRYVGVQPHRHANMATIYAAESPPPPPFPPSP